MAPAFWVAGAAFAAVKNITGQYLMAVEQNDAKKTNSGIGIGTVGDTVGDNSWDLCLLRRHVVAGNIANLLCQAPPWPALGPGLQTGSVCLSACLLILPACCCGHAVDMGRGRGYGHRWTQVPNTVQYIL